MAKMRRTARRPIPSGRMSLLHASIVGGLLAVGGSIYLVFSTNWLTGLLTFLTSLVYLLAYTPLKRISPICTFVGAFPGAMPGVLGWTAARGRLDWGTLALFAILFLWQFPHFFAIAWMYREDYDWRRFECFRWLNPTDVRLPCGILLYSLALLPISLAPAFLGMTGRIYLGGAIVLGLMFVFFSARMIFTDLPVANSQSRIYARQLFRCSILYLPLLFILMMSNSLKG